MEQAKAKTDEFRQRVTEANPKFELVGMLTREKQRWVYLPIGTPSSESGTLVVLQKSGEKVQPVRVGTLRNGTGTLANTINVSQCSPVFLVN
jgi:hypothetical protein